MKTAEQWQEELSGETSVIAIKRIQLDALASAIRAVANYRQSRADAVSEVAIEMEKLIES